MSHSLIQRRHGNQTVARSLYSLICFRWMREVIFLFRSELEFAAVFLAIALSLTMRLARNCHPEPGPARRGTSPME